MTRPTPRSSYHQISVVKSSERKNFHQSVTFCRQRFGAGHDPQIQVPVT